MSAVEILARILDEERTARIQADRVLGDAREESDTWHRDYLFQLDRNQELTTQNHELREDLRNYRSVPTPDYKMHYERLMDIIMPKMTELVVRPTYDKDPAFYSVNKIPFIKEVRELTGLGLKESKDLVDQFLMVEGLVKSAAEVGKSVE